MWLGLMINVARSTVVYIKKYGRLKEISSYLLYAAFILITIKKEALLCRLVYYGVCVSLINEEGLLSINILLL